MCGWAATCCGEAAAPGASLTPLPTRGAPAATLPSSGGRERSDHPTKFVDRYTGAEHVDWQLSRLAHRGAVKMLVVSETNLVSVKRCHADARQKLDASGDRANT